MFISLRRATDETVTVKINGQLVTAPTGQTVWATMALSGQKTTRKAALSGQNRSAYCAMGVCFECMVEINGIPNQQACLREVHDGMVIETQMITEQSKSQANDF